MMKKIILSVICCIVLMPLDVFAAGVGSVSASVESGKWGLGVFNDQMLDKKFRIRTGEGAGVLLTAADIDESSTTGLEARYGLLDALSIFFRIGYSDRTLKTEYNDGGVTEMDYDQSPFFGGGLRYIVGSPEDFMIVLNGQIAVQSGDEVETVRESGVTAARITEPGEGKLEEYQGSILFCFNFPFSESFNVLPYLGMTANNSKLKSDELKYEVTAGGGEYTIARLELEESNRFGFVLGANLRFGKQFSFNIEGRLKSETAFSVGINYSF